MKDSEQKNYIFAIRGFHESVEKIETERQRDRDRQRERKSERQTERQRVLPPDELVPPGPIPLGAPMPIKDIPSLSYHRSKNSLEAG